MADAKRGSSYLEYQLILAEAIHEVVRVDDFGFVLRPEKRWEIFRVHRVLVMLEIPQSALYS